MVQKELLECLASLAPITTGSSRTEPEKVGLGWVPVSGTWSTRLLPTNHLRAPKDLSHGIRCPENTIHPIRSNR